jgi:hypothetical protein
MPEKAGIPYPEKAQFETVGRHGVLNHPSEPVIGPAEGGTRWRAMTERIETSRLATISGAAPLAVYSAGLASGGGGLAEGGAPAAVFAAAARFSTRRTATIEPS